MTGCDEIANSRSFTAPILILSLLLDSRGIGLSGNQRRILSTEGVAHSSHLHPEVGSSVASVRNANTVSSKSTIIPILTGRMRQFKDQPMAQETL